MGLIEQIGTHMERAGRTKDREDRTQDRMIDAIKTGADVLVSGSRQEDLVNIATKLPFDCVQFGEYRYGHGNFLGIRFTDADITYEFALPTEPRWFRRVVVKSAWLVGISMPTRQGLFHEQYIIYTNGGFTLASRADNSSWKWEPLDRNHVGQFPKKELGYIRSIIKAAGESEFLPPRTPLVAHTKI